MVGGAARRRGAELDGDSNGGRDGNARSDRKQLERARGGAEWLQGEVARLQARRIEAGWRALAGAMNDDGSSSSLRYA